MDGTMVCINAIVVVAFIFIKQKFIEGFLVFFCSFLIILTVFLLSLAGFPGTGGFMAKIFLLQGAVESDLWTLAIVLVMATLFSYWYYLRVVWFMWMREASSPDANASVYAPFLMRFALFGAAGLILFLGIFPSAFGFLEFVQSSVESLTRSLRLPHQAR